MVNAIGRKLYACGLLKNQALSRWYDNAEMVNAGDRPGAGVENMPTT
jgi:hypothetical protein